MTRSPSGYRLKALRMVSLATRALLISITFFWGTLGIGTLSANSVVLFETGFERFEGYNPTNNLVGQAGWIGEGSGGNGLLDSTIPGFSGQVAYVGFSPPVSPDSVLNAWHPLGFIPSAGELPVVQFSVRFQIQDSTTAAPYFDDFRWSVYGTDGHRFFTLDFDNDSRRVFYLLDEASTPGNPFHDTQYTFSNGFLYDLVLTLDMARNLWSAKVNDAVIVNAQPITTQNHPLSLGDIDAVWAIGTPNKPGDNFMIFDDYRVELTPLTEIPPQLELIGMDPTTGAFAIQVWGEPGIGYSLEATTDMRKWVPISQVLPVFQWEIGWLRVSGQEVLGRLDGVEQAGGELRGPQGAAS